MLHILSKLFQIFLSPLTWVVLLLILSLLSKKAILKKRFLVSAFAILLIFSNKFLINQFALAWDIRTYPPTDKTYSCVIILGGFASEGPGDQGGHFNGSADRFIQGLKLWEQKKAQTILISGGNASIFKKKFLEADFVQSQLKQFNVPDSSILIENKSKNTIENAKFTKRLLESKNLQPPYLLVTSAFHMRRSLKTFTTAGLNAVAYPADYKTGLVKTEFKDFLPSAEALALWPLYIKEFIGYLMDFRK